jgi:large subunit ribosomal protein L4
VLAAEESSAALSFRNLARTSVLTHESVGVADLLGAASLVLSQAALDALTVRAAKKERAGGDTTTHDPAARAREGAPGRED